MPGNQSGSLNPTPPYAHHVILLPNRSKTQRQFHIMKRPSMSSNPAPTPPSTSPISSTRLTSTSQAPQTVLTNLSPFGNKILRTHRQTVPHLPTGSFAGISPVTYSTLSDQTPKSSRVKMLCFTSSFPSQKPRFLQSYTPRRLLTCSASRCNTPKLNKVLSPFSSNKMACEAILNESSSQTGNAQHSPDIPSFKPWGSPIF